MVRLCCSFIFVFNTDNRKKIENGFHFFNNEKTRIGIEFKCLCSEVETIANAVLSFSGLCNRIIVIGLYEFLNHFI